MLIESHRPCNWGSLESNVQTAAPEPSPNQSRWAALSSRPLSTRMLGRGVCAALDPKWEMSKRFSAIKTSCAVTSCQKWPDLNASLSGTDINSTNFNFASWKSDSHWITCFTTTNLPKKGTHKWHQVTQGRWQKTQHDTAWHSSVVDRCHFAPSPSGRVPSVRK